MPTPLYSLERLPFRTVCLHYIRLCFEEAVKLNALPLNINISRAKSLQLFCELMARDPAPLLDYIYSGALKRAVLVGKGKYQHFEWSNTCYRDTRKVNKM